MKGKLLKPIIILINVGLFMALAFELNKTMDLMGGEDRAAKGESLKTTSDGYGALESDATGGVIDLKSIQKTRNGYIFDYRMPANKGGRGAMVQRVEMDCSKKAFRTLSNKLCLFDEGECIDLDQKASGNQKKAEWSSDVVSTSDGGTKESPWVRHFCKGK